MSPELLESLRQSPYTPWIGTALFVIVGLGLIKLVAKSGAKLIVLLLLAGLALFGYQWWGQPSERQLSDMKDDWFRSLEESDLSKSGLQALAQKTGQLLQEAGALTQEKGQAFSADALQSISAKLQEKIRRAKESGEDEAVQQIERLHERVMESLQQ